jgi:hypothetical protein
VALPWRHANADGRNNAPCGGFWKGALAQADHSITRSNTMAGTTETHETRDLISSDHVEDSFVYNPEGERLGTVQRFMVDRQTGKARYAVLQLGGLGGIGGDYYPIPWELLIYQPSQGGYVVEITRDQLCNAPHYGVSATPQYDRAFGERICSHYGLTYD